MRQFSKKLVSIFLSVVLVLGIFSIILPTAKLIQNAKAETILTEYVYNDDLLDGKGDGTSVNDTRIWDFADGIKHLGIWNAMGLNVTHEALGISQNFFGGTEVGAERNEIHPYIVYNVTPGTSFKLYSAIHKDCKEEESVLNFYVSNDGTTWVPIDTEKETTGLWEQEGTYDSFTSGYIYTIDNVGLKTNFVKAEYPMTMDSSNGNHLLVYKVAFVPVADYAVNGQTLFEAKSFGAQKELYEEYFIAYPDFVYNGSENAAASDYTMLANSTWGDFDVKDRSYIAMVAPGSHFYLETANNWYMKTLGEALVANGELDSADKARIRVYSSASLSDDAAWTEHDPMPFSFGGNHTPTFNFYLPKDHIYVRIVYPQQGKVGTAPGFADTSCVGNDAAFFNDMVFTPYVKAEEGNIRDYTGDQNLYEDVKDVKNLTDDNDNGVTIPYRGEVNLRNGHAQNTGDPYKIGDRSITYEVEGGKMFNLEYGVRLGSYFIADWPGNTKGAYEAEVTDNSSMEMIIQTSTDNSTWTNTYVTESGYAQTTSSFNTQCYVYDVSYLVPKDAKYVRVSFGITGVGYLNHNNEYCGFHDCLYIRKVSFADANNVYVAPEASSEPVEYIYTTDTDASKATSTSNAVVGSLNGATGFRGDYGHLVAGEGGDKTRTLAGTLERPYVVYDVVPGSNFSFDYTMRATAKAASEATAALNIKGGLGRADLAEYEFSVYGRADENGDWKYIDKTDSSALSFADGANTSSYDTFGLGNGSFTIPAGVNQVKVELPGTGAFTTATPVVWDYTTMSGDFGGWNANSIGGYAENAAGNVMNCQNGKGLTIAYNEGNAVAWGNVSLYVIYKVARGTTFIATTNMPDANTRNGYAGKTGEPFEFKLQYSTDNSTWSEAVTTAGQGTSGVLAFTVPATSEYSEYYVKVTFPQKGFIPELNYLANDNTYLTGVSFYNPGAWITAGDDAACLYNVEYATGVVVDPDAYIYTTDTDASKATSTSNAVVGSLNGATGFRGDYGHLVAGEGGDKTRTLAGTLERPYVVYDVVPGSNFSFDYTMRATAKAASEATAALNIKGGLGRADLAEYEFSVYGRKDESSDWKYIDKTDSGALSFADGANTSSYDTFGLGNGSFTIPAGITQVKVELPGTGAFTTATPVAWDYTTMSGDFGGWNANSIGGYAENAAGNVMNCQSGNGLTIAYNGDNAVAWGNVNLYVTYKVARGTTFVATTKMPDADTRNYYATYTKEPFEFKLQYSADNSNWSEAITTAGQGTNGVLAFTVPATSDYSEYYVRVTFPQRGFVPLPSGNFLANNNTYLTGVSFYNPGAWITAGDDAACLYNVEYATGKKPGPDVDYTELGNADITNDNKYTVNAYNFGEVSIVNGEGVVANSDEAFVTYKIKEDTILTVNPGGDYDLSFEYSVDDSDYKPFTAVKTCYGYVIPAIAERNYIKVKLNNGEAIANADAEVLVPTARFYIPYLNKYELKDYASYGVAANSVPSAELIRPGYTFAGWDSYNSDSVYIDKTFEATFNKVTDKEEYTYTVEYTVGEETTTKQDLHFDDAFTITAPATNDAGQKFSKWVDDKGVTVSYKQSFTILANGDLSLRAVYASDKANIGAHIYATDEPIIKKNDNGTWNMSVVWRIEITEDVKLVETGILYGRDVEQANLILLDGEAQASTAKVKHSNTDANRTAMYTVKNIASGQTRTALPYAILSNGDVIYGERAIKVTGGDLVESSTFEFNKDGIPVTVLNKYLDRTVSYDAFGSINGQTQAEAVADARDFVRRTGTKYLARATGAWIPNKTDIYGDNFTNYTKWASEIHEADPDVILEACIFETVTSATDGLAIPKWVQEAFGLTYNPDLTFDHTEMMHDAKYWSGLSQKTFGENKWGDGIHIPSISKVQTQMYIYYRACTYIDMGFEAIHLGQMYRIGANKVSSADNVNSVDYVNWELVLNKITKYAETHARRGYVLFNGHTEDFVFENANGSQMLDFNMSPVRIQADAITGTKQTATSTDLQPVRLSKSTDGENVPYLDVTKNVTTRSGETCDYFPYLLEFDNFGYDKYYIDKAKTTSQYDYVWGYDEISWYANQDPTLRAEYLSTLNDSIKGLASAPNGHVAMPGRRTAYISNTGCSEYKDFAWVQALMDDNGIAKVSLWEVSETDIAGIIAAWN